MSYIVANIISIIYLNIVGTPIRDLLKGKINKVLLHDLIVYSIPMIANGIAWWVITASDRFILQYFKGEASVGIYSVASKIPTLISTFSGVFMQAWIISAVTEFDEEREKQFYSKVFHDFLVGYAPEKANQFCMAGFILKNTLSENGAVTRGICETNEEGYLTAVHETSNIVKTPEGAAVDNDGQLTSINAESYASMNMWGLTPEFMQTLEDGFKEFFANMGDKDILKAEYLLPIYIDELLQAGKVSVKVLDTNDKWFGVTYKEDKDYVVKSFAKLIEDGVYQKNLFEDLK